MNILTFDQIKNGDIVIWNGEQEFDPINKRKIINKNLTNDIGLICYLKDLNSSGFGFKRFLCSKNRIHTVQFLLLSRKDNDNDIGLDFL